MTDDQLRDLARRAVGGDESGPYAEIGDHAQVMRTDSGAFVEAWVWVEEVNKEN